MATQDHATVSAHYRALRIQAEDERPRVTDHAYVGGHGSSCVLDGRSREEHREPLAVTDARIRAMVQEYLR